MKHDPFLGLGPRLLKRPIFRVCTFQRMKDAIRHRRITLVRPRLWNDPFENFILNAPYITRHGATLQASHGRHFFGQCWSRQKESDAMWRIYAPNGDGVKIRAMPRPLAAAVDAACRGIPEARFFIGRVRYLSRMNMKHDVPKLLNLTRIFDGTDVRDHAKTFLVKRAAFDHEKEVRLILHCPTHEQNDIIHIPVAPTEVFEELIFDPRTSQKEYKRKAAELVAAGFPRSQIKRSGLYDPPKIVFDLRERKA